EWRALETLRARLAAQPPDGLLMLGIAGRRRAVHVETRAVNQARGLDAARCRPARRITAGGVPQRRLRASAPALVQAVRQAGVDAAPSRDAGRYLCNAAYYVALESISGRAIPVVFVHLPGRGRTARQPVPRILVALSALLRTLMRA
ncbi:MAG: peptidase C15, partial [Pseudomonadota bacterium]